MTLVELLFFTDPRTTVEPEEHCACGGDEMLGTTDEEEHCVHGGDEMLGTTNEEEDCACRGDEMLGTTDEDDSSLTSSTCRSTK